MDLRYCSILLDKKKRYIHGNFSTIALDMDGCKEENYNKGIHILPSDAPVGIDAFTYLGIGDTLYDLDVHKHKNNDYWQDLDEKINDFSQKNNYMYIINEEPFLINPTDKPIIINYFYHEKNHTPQIT